MFWLLWLLAKEKQGFGFTTTFWLSFDFRSNTYICSNKISAKQDLNPIS
jgi:hypothetical protein